MELDRVLSIWWLPDDRDTEFPGQVSRRADGAITIELFGSLGGSPMPLEDAPEPSIMHGLGHQGPLMTARQVIRAGSSVGFPGFTTEKLRPRSMIVGAHVDGTTLYDQAILKTSFLREWLQLTGIRISFKSGTDEEKGSIGVAYEWPGVLTAQALPGVKVSTWSGHQGKQLRSGYAINEDVALKIVLDTPVPIDDLVRGYAMPLVDLISFATGRSNAVDGLVVRTPSVIDKVGAESQPRDLEFLTEWTAQTPTDDPPSLYDMNFALGDASMGFEPLLQRWFEIQSTLRPCLAPYFGLLYAPPTYVDQRLVSISQALEGYERTLGSHRAMPKDEFDAFRKALLAACPPERVDFLRQKLGYLNQVGQVARTTALVERTSPVLERMLARRRTFAVDFIRARDARTHPEEGGEEVGGPQLYDLTRAATYIFETCIMLDLGFDEQQCRVLVERQQEYLYFADHPPV